MIFVIKLSRDGCYNWQMNWKRFFLIYFIIIQQITIFKIFAYDNLINLDDVPAKGIAVIDVDTGRLIYGKNENTRMAMASTTKIMTALITLEQPDLNSYFTVDPQAIKIEGTSMGLLEGDKVCLRDLAVGMLLPSGNDAAEVAAIKIAGTQSNFIKLMNKKANALGCVNTNFATTSGLDDDNHYSTPRDMAIIARHALMNNNFAEICKKQYETLKFGNPPYTRTLKNHNKLLSKYPYCIGVKTGFTDNAGKCLVSAAEKDGVRLIVVTLNSDDICESHIDIYDKMFKHTCRYTPAVKLPVHNVRVVGGEIVGVPIEKKYDSDILIVDGEEKKIRNKIKLKKFLYAPVKKGEIVGEVGYYIGNKKIAVDPVTVVMDVNPEKNRSFWHEFLDSFIYKENLLNKLLYKK